MYEQFYDHEMMDAIDCIESSRIKKERRNWAEAQNRYVACVIFEVNILRMAYYNLAKESLLTSVRIVRNFMRNFIFVRVNDERD